MIREHLYAALGISAQMGANVGAAVGGNMGVATMGGAGQIHSLLSPGGFNAPAMSPTVFPDFQGFAPAAGMGMMPTPYGLQYAAALTTSFPEFGGLNVGPTRYQSQGYRTGAAGPMGFGIGFGPGSGGVQGGGQGKKGYGRQQKQPHDSY